MIHLYFVKIIQIFLTTSTRTECLDWIRFLSAAQTLQIVKRKANS